MHQFVSPNIHCINPHCPSPVQTWGNKYCQSCGTPLLLNHRYIPLRQLGLGGFAKIHIVWDLKTQTERILKVLLEASPKALELFDREAKVLMKLRHPGIPRVEPGDYFYLQRRNNNPGQIHPINWLLPCLVMEKIEGPTLEEILEQHPQGCPEKWVVNWLSQATQTLWELHRWGIIHRDIKPSNLMLRTSQGGQALHGQLVTIDFGGAKQISLFRDRPPESRPKKTTRLISPGYSPPEQMAGREIGPPADFYALGRTCIHLLTGKYPADIEDPATGELQWRRYTRVGLGFGNLLDDMISYNPEDRPTTAAKIQVRLGKIYRRQKRFGWIGFLRAFLWKLAIAILTTISKFIRQIVAGCLDTLWEIILGGIGGCIGATLGLVLAYWSAVGDRVSSLLASDWFEISGLSVTFGAEVVVFALAGLMTAIAFTDTGSFGQRRHYWLAAFAGSIGYLLGGLCWEVARVGAIAYSASNELIVFETLEKLSWGIATGVLTLGLGLKSHKLVQALIVTATTAIIFASFDAFDLFPETFLQFVVVSGSKPKLWEFFANIGFFALLGSVGGFCLGVSHYLIVPVLRWFGLR